MLLAYPDGRIDSPRLRKRRRGGYAICRHRAAAVAAVRRRRAARLRQTARSRRSSSRTTRRSSRSSTCSRRWSPSCSSATSLYVVAQALAAARTRPAAARDGARALVRRRACSSLLAGALTSEAVDGPDAVSDVDRPPRARLLRPRALRVPVRPAALARPAGGRGDRAAAPDGRRPGPAAGCATCSRPRSATARCRSSTGSRTSAAGSTPTAARPRSPPTTTPRAPFTRVEREGRAVGAIVHDRSLCDDPELVGSVAAAAGLSIENERLQAQLRARVEELRASRARIVEAGTAERRRLERNLHDGAQQRLVALSLTLRVAQGKLHKDPDGAERLLGGAQEELTPRARGAARAGPRHPSRPCSRTAASRRRSRRSPAARRCPSSSTGTPPERLPARGRGRGLLRGRRGADQRRQVRRTRRRPACGSRAATATPSWRSPTTASAGADPDRGSGLRGLADRVSALDGTLELRSPEGAGTLLRAEIPV